MKGRFSQRTHWSFELNRVTEVLNQVRSQGNTVLDLTCSNPTRCEFFYPENILSSLSTLENLHYTPDPQGLPKARQAVSDYYRRRGFDVSPARIFLTANTSEAYSYLFRLLADPGDHVLFPRPSYPLFQFLSTLNDVTLDFYPMRYDKQWRIDFETLSASVTNRTKALVLVNPNNPTGSFVGQETLQQIKALCLEKRLAIISDEVFWDFAFDETLPHESLVSNQAGLTFVLGGLSKSLGLPQMKLSWMVLGGERESVAEAAARLEMIADTYLSVNTPVQNALETWLSCGERMRNAIRNRVRTNYVFLKGAVEEIEEVEVRHVEGGWYAMLRLPDGLSEEETVLNLLREAHVFVHPGYFFDCEEAPYLVLSLLPQEELFKEGVERILKHKF